MNPFFIASLLVIFAWATLLVGALFLSGTYLTPLYTELGEPLSAIARFLTYGALGTAWLVAWFKLAKLYLLRQLKRRLPKPPS